MLAKNPVDDRIGHDRIEPGRQVDHRDVGFVSEESADALPSKPVDQPGSSVGSVVCLVDSGHSVEPTIQFGRVRAAEPLHRLQQAGLDILRCVPDGVPLLRVIEPVDGPLYRGKGR